MSKLHGVETSLLNALIQVAVSQEFADHSAVNQVIGKFDEIKWNLQTSLA